MKRQAKLIISLAYWAWMAVYGRIATLAGRTRPRQMIILYYHAVSTRRRSQFVRQLDWLNRHTTVVPARSEGWPQGARHVTAITFDDAFESVVENALPELAARNFHCTIFAPSGVLGRQPDWAMEGDGDQDERVVDAVGLKSLIGPLVTVGSHSATHPRLSKIPPDRARAEIAGSRLALTKITGEEMTLFAFPYGDHDNAVIQICREEGYEQVFTIIPRPVSLEHPTFVRGRVSVNPDDGLLEFALKASGAYAWMPWASSLKRRLRSPGSEVSK